MLIIEFSALESVSYFKKMVKNTIFQKVIDKLLGVLN